MPQFVTLSLHHNPHLHPLVNLPLRRLINHLHNQICIRQIAHRFNQVINHLHNLICIRQIVHQLGQVTNHLRSLIGSRQIVHQLVLVINHLHSQLDHRRIIHQQVQVTNHQCSQLDHRQINHLHILRDLLRISHHRSQQGLQRFCHHRNQAVNPQVRQVNRLRNLVPILPAPQQLNHHISQRVNRQCNLAARRRINLVAFLPTSQLYCRHVALPYNPPACRQRFQQLSRLGRHLDNHQIVLPDSPQVNLLDSLPQNLVDYRQGNHPYSLQAGPVINRRVILQCNQPINQRYNHTESQAEVRLCNPRRSQQGGQLDNQLCDLQNNQLLNLPDVQVGNHLLNRLASLLVVLHHNLVRGLLAFQLRNQLVSPVRSRQLIPRRNRQVNRQFSLHRNHLIDLPYNPHASLQESPQVNLQCSHLFNLVRSHLTHRRPYRRVNLLTIHRCSQLQNHQLNQLRVPVDTPPSARLDNQHVSPQYILVGNRQSIPLGNQAVGLHHIPRDNQRVYPPVSLQYGLLLSHLVSLLRDLLLSLPSNLRNALQCSLA